jgi:hypothetical protein
MNRSDLPKQLKDFYLQHKKQHPDTALLLNGFVVVYKEAGSLALNLQTQSDWQYFLEENVSKEYLAIEPLINLNPIVGHALLSAIHEKKPEVVNRLLDMGFDPFLRSPQGGENALHWCVSSGNLQVLQRLVNEFKMSLTESTGLGRACLNGLFVSKMTEEMLQWFYSLPNLDEIMESNKHTNFSAVMNEFRKERLQKEMNEIRSSILSLTITSCTSLQFFGDVFKILDDKTDEAEPKKILKVVCETALLFIQDDVVRKWISEQRF